MTFSLLSLTVLSLSTVVFCTRACVRTLRVPYRVFNDALPVVIPLFSPDTDPCVPSAALILIVYLRLFGCMSSFPAVVVLAPPIYMLRDFILLLPIFSRMGDLLS